MILHFTQHEIENMMRRQLETEGYSVVDDKSNFLLKKVGWRKYEVEMEIKVQRDLLPAVKPVKEKTAKSFEEPQKD